MPETATLCPYCGVGCGLLVEVRDGRVARVRGDPAHPSSRGDVCAKAVHLPPTLLTADRLLHPQIRARRDGALVRVPWDLAVRTVAERLGEILAAHGPDAIAFYASGQLTTEEYYVAGKLAKGFLRTNNFDTNSRLCMASAAAAYTRSLGADGPPCSYDDLDAADCFLLVGANTADCHPVLFKRLRRRKAAAPDEVGVILQLQYDQKGADREFVFTREPDGWRKVTMTNWTVEIPPFPHGVKESFNIRAPDAITGALSLHLEKSSTDNHLRQSGCGL